MRASKRKRERQKRRYAQRPKLVDKPIAAKISTSGLIAELARPLSSRAFDEALQETQHT
jgi:hypothetical protein